MKDTLTRLDPRFAPEHAAYYLRGVMQHTGSGALPLTREGFPATYVENKPLAMTLRRGEIERNIYIAADDMPELDEAALEWADVYAKVNLLRDLVPPTSGRKVVPIGPSHGLNIWGLRDTLQLAWRADRAGGRIVGRREHYRRFWILYRRRGDDALYEPGTSEDRYVFFNSWLWAKHGDVNPPRAEYVRACKELGSAIEFEGGFIARRRDDMPEYNDLLADRKYSLPEYLENIKRSAVVFNNPAVHRCHGWKLAEFLRLGKAIVSTPLERELPAPLVHGEHLHVVDGSRESIKQAVQQIVEDPPYRQRLEQGARSYYLEYLTPRRVIERVADIAFGSEDVGTAGDTSELTEQQAGDVSAGHGEAS